MNTDPFSASFATALSADPIFKPGDKVTPVYVDGYVLTMGTIYTVTEYEPNTRDPTFTWPAYVHLKDDWNRPVVAHAARFKLA